MVDDGQWWLKMVDDKWLVVVMFDAIIIHHEQSPSVFFLFVTL